MVGFFQRLIGLRDERRGPLDALLAVGDLLGELPEPLCLWRKGNAKRSLKPDRTIKPMTSSSRPRIIRDEDIIRADDGKFPKNMGAKKVKSRVD